VYLYSRHLGLRVRTDDDDDWTDGMLHAAHRMLDVARDWYVRRFGVV
jgi:hypothetical protein